ncbi:MAG: AAA family ATPase [Gemmatimonadetes bacterium]|nr:MAG: AAA family ATPase [Gemmatimonadota bacterium]
MPLAAYHFQFNDPQPVTSPLPQTMMKDLNAQLEVAEWLCLRYAGNCEMFLIEAEPLGTETVWSLLQETGIVPKGKPEEAQYRFHREAIHYFYAITTGIIGQTRGKRLLEILHEAYAQAVEMTYAGPILHRLFHRGVWLHEKVRLETRFFRFAVDEESVLRELAGKVLGHLTQAVTYIMGYQPEVVYQLEELRQGGCRKFVFVGDEPVDDVVIRVSGEVRSPQALRVLPVETDILLICEGAPPMFKQPQVIQERMNRRHNAPLFILDQTGGYFEPKTLKKLYNVYHYQPQDLTPIIRYNRQEQRAEAARIEPWIREEVSAFYDWYRTEERFQFAGMIGANPQMRRIFELISRISQTDITVLIDGESGTGKELVARAIHDLSARRDKPFIAVNCGAIPENLLESELFGHMKGAFTGATASKQGLFESADQGTIFLDEIGELPASLQVKLLRFLQEGELKRVGSNATLQLDVRVLAATNKHLEKLVENGEFRSDLYYRLNVIQLTLPPLRERQEDIPLLAQHFLRKYARKLNKDVAELSPEAMEALLHYRWQGNVRELENVMERAVALTVGKSISVYDLPPALQNVNHQTSSPMETDAKARLTLKEVEKKYILETLDLFDWNYDEVCRQLGIGRTTLWRKLREYGVSESSTKT